MIRNLIAKRVEQAKNDERGLTLAELLIALSITGLVMTLTLLIFTSSVRTQNDIQNSVVGSSQSQLVMTKFSKSIRTASAFRITSSTRLDLRTEAGTCESWVFNGGALYTKINSGALPGTTIDSTWKKMLTPVTQIGTTPYFSPAPGTGLAYTFNAGEGISNIDFVGKATPRAPQDSASPCW